MRGTGCAAMRTSKEGKQPLKGDGADLSKLSPRPANDDYTRNGRRLSSGVDGGHPRPRVEGGSGSSN